MAATTKLTIRNVFADDTKVTITIDNLKKSNIDIERIRQKVMEFNAASGGELSTKMKSKNGFNWTGIEKVNVITTEREYIF